MSNSVQKYCSILNYIEDKDPKLYKLIHDLCIGRIFVPRKGTSGITFLHPDKSLLDEIIKKSSSDNDEDVEYAVNSLKSCVLLDYLEDTTEFGDGEISTFMRKKLPVDKADEKKVILGNGAIITPNKDFNPRNDRRNIAIFNLSGKLVPFDGQSASTNDKPKSRSEKKGGGDYKTGSRAQLFERVYSTMHKYYGKRNTAAEVLVSLMDYVKKTPGNENTLNLIRSQLSGDTLASLAIILQPYRSTYTYIDDTLYKSWAAASHNTAFMDLFCYKPNVLQCYVEEMNEYKKSANYKNTLSTILNNQNDLIHIADKATLVSLFNSFYNSTRNSIPGRNNPKLSFCEAELRVFSAVIQEHQKDSMDDYWGLLNIYKEKCLLNDPYISGNSGDMLKANIGVYYSSAYLIARSDALLYIPGLGDNYSGRLSNKNDVVNDLKTIKLIDDTPTGDDSVYDFFKLLMQKN